MEAFKNKYYSIIIEGGILYFTFYVENLSVEIAKEAIRDRLQVQNGISMPALIDCRNLFLVEQGARNYLSDEAGAENLSASALLIQTPNQDIHSRVYIHHYRPFGPVQVFYDKEEAVNWLKTFCY